MLTKEQIRKLIEQVGGEIQDKLSPLPYRKKRNAYAHIYGAINSILGCTYAEADPDEVEALVKYIHKNPNASHQYMRLFMISYLDQKMERYDEEVNPLIKE